MTAFMFESDIIKSISKWLLQPLSQVVIIPYMNFRAFISVLEKKGFSADVPSGWIFVGGLKGIGQQK